MEIIVTNDFAHVADRFAAAAAEVHPTIAASVGAFGDRVVAIYEPMLMAHTPVDTGALRDSTDHTMVADGVEFIQPEESADGEFYAQDLIHGHRIVARGYDTGRSTDPIPYPEDALDETSDEIDGLLVELGIGATARIVAVLG